MSQISNRILSEFSEKEFRDAYVDARTRNLIAYQIRALRDQNGWSQSDLAEKLPSGKQSTVSRYEDPDYGRLSLTSIFNLAAAYDVAVIVKFCSHEEFLIETEDLSPENLRAPRYNKERVTAALMKEVSSQSIVTIPSGILPNFAKLSDISLSDAPPNSAAAPSAIFSIHDASSSTYTLNITRPCSTLIGPVT